VADFKTLREVLDAASGRHRFWALLLGVLAGVSLSLAAAGVYGVVAGFVQGRLPEFAVRAAVGAGPVDIFGMVLSRTLKLAAAGALAGILAALAMGRMLASLLFEVSPTDSLTLGATVLVALCIALAAACLPARAAARAHPASLLRLN
jgi:ABC-type antimicrobial peptide transport system permease subunit